MTDNSINIVGASLIEEQETTVCIDHQRKRANIYSSKQSVIQQLQGWIRDYPDAAVCLHADKFGLEISVPVEWVKLRAPKRRSEEWKTAAHERLQEARSKRWEREST